MVLAAFLPLCILALWLRAPVAQVRGVQNEDVAGILYNADLLLSGHVPLRDNLEYKAPGSFFLTAAVFGVFGRSVKVHEYFGVFWSLLATLGVLCGGRVMFGLASGVVAALLYVVASPITDSMTVNYNSWMIAPYIWATVLLLVGFKHGRLWAFVLAGAVAVIGALMKRQGAVIVPLFGAVLLFAPYLPGPPGWAPLRRWRSLLGFSLGVAAGFAPILIYYWANDATGAFISHYFGSGAGWEYARGEEVDWAGKRLRLEDGVLGLWEFMALPSLLAVFSLFAIPAARQKGWRLFLALLGGHLLMSFIGAALGFRFYKGYYLQILPSAAWLAVHPDGLLLRWFLRSWPVALRGQWARVGAAFCALLACVPAARSVLDKSLLQRLGRPRMNAHQLEAQAIAQLIARNTKPYERIWVWGRWAWPVYFHADRLAVTRYYKVLGLLTTNLTNTWKRPTTMTRFVKKGPWQVLGQQLEARKPPFIVTANNESYRGFTHLERVLRTDYEIVPASRLRLTAFRVYVQTGRELLPRLAPQSQPAFRVSSQPTISPRSKASRDARRATMGHHLLPRRRRLVSARGIERGRAGHRLPQKALVPKLKAKKSP